MAIAAKVLADGTLGVAKATLYTVPGATTAYVKFLRVHNTSATTQVIVVYAKPGATSRIIGRVVLKQNETAHIIESGEALTLETGDLIEGESTTGAVVHYIITGAEET